MDPLHERDSRKMHSEGLRDWYSTLNSKWMVKSKGMKGAGHVARKVEAKSKGHPCTGTEALYRPYGP